MDKAPFSSTFLAFALLLLSISEHGYSQHSLQLGLRVVPQATTFRYATGLPVQDWLKASPYYFRIRTTQGVGLLYYPYPRWSLGVDVLYALQGGGYEARKTNLNYLKTVLWLGYSASPRKRVGFNLQAGIDIAYLVRARLHYRDGKKVNIAPYVNQTNWGVPLAAGLQWKVARNYRLNTQLLFYTDFISLASTNSSFRLQNYVLPGIRFSLNRQLRKNNQ